MDNLNLELLYTRLNFHRQCWGISWNTLATQAKVSSTLWSRIARGVEPSAEDLAKLQVWLEAWGDLWS